MGENRGGPRGMSTVRLDPAKEPLHPKDELPPGDPGEDHAASVLDAAKSADPVPRSAQAGEGAEGAEVSFEQMKMEEDAEFMKKYQDLDMDELVVTGKLSHKATIAKQEFVIKTLTDAESEAVEEELSSMINSERPMAQTHVAALIRRHVLARSLVSVNGESLGESPKDRYDRLKAMAMPILLLLHEEYRSLNKAVAILLTGSSGNSLERLLIGPERL